MIERNALVIRNIHWREAIPIRHQVLWPSESPEFCYVDGDESKEALHFGAFIDSQLVSVASIYLDGANARLRKFATLESHQGQGVGSTLLRYILSDIQASGVRYFWCDARESAISFYRRFNLVTEGERFYKADIPYYKMSCYF